MAGWLGCRPAELAIEPASGGRSTPVFHVRLGELETYLRLGTQNASLGPEALAHEVLLSAGVQVPAVIGYEPFDPVLERSAMLTTAVPGTAVDTAAPVGRDAVLVLAGADLARINQVPVDGFGWVRRDDPLPTRLRADSAWDAFAADLTREPLDDWFDTPVAARIAELARLAPDDPTHAVLAHGDFDPSHLFVHNNRYAGIIDFGEIRGAEPSYDLGHLALHAPDALEPVLAGYASIAKVPGRDQIVASAIRIGWFRLTQSSARANPAYARQLVAGMIRLAPHR